MLHADLRKKKPNLRGKRKSSTVAPRKWRLSLLRDVDVNPQSRVRDPTLTFDRRYLQTCLADGTIFFARDSLTGFVQAKSGDRPLYYTGSVSRPHLAQFLHIRPIRNQRLERLFGLVPWTGLFLCCITGSVSRSVRPLSRFRL